MAPCILIGIDPDCKKSGVCTYRPDTKEMSCDCMTYFQLFDYLIYSKKHACEIKVYLEAGWLHDKSNFNYAGRKGSRYTAERIAKNVGSNHEAGRKIEEALVYLQIPYELIKPTNHKLDHFTFCRITGYKGKTNQEHRDAAMLIYGR